MKKSALFLSAVLFLLSANEMFAQHNSSLKGPAFKNFKPWKKSNHPKNTTTVLMSNRSVTTGPSVKNAEMDRSNQSSIGMQVSSIKMNSLMSKNPIAARRIKEKMKLMHRKINPIPSVVRSEF